MDQNNIRREEGFPFQFNSDICRTCNGTCCRGLAGYVWLSLKEIQGIADMKNMPATDFSRQYIRRVNGKLSLRERVVNGEHFCCFFDPVGCRCTIYDKRPEQCRTFPFWNQFKDDLIGPLHECPGIVIRDSDTSGTG